MGQFRNVWLVVKTTVARSFELEVKEELTLMQVIRQGREKRAKEKRQREQLAKDLQMLAEHEAKYKSWLDSQRQLEIAAARAEEEAEIAAALEREERIRLYWDNRRLHEQLSLGDGKSEGGEEDENRY